MTASAARPGASVAALAAALAVVAAAAAGEPVRVGIDAGHGNYHTAAGRYAPFAELVRADGGEVTDVTATFTAAGLADLDLLVIANALAPANRDRWSLPTPSAFTAGEIAAVAAWVAAGGRLLLIADHMPFPGAAGALAAAFGIVMDNGFVVGARDDGILRFDAGDSTLAAHPIVRGGDGDAPIPFVLSFTGHAFRVEAGRDAQPLLVVPAGAVMLLPETAWEFSETTPRRDAAGLWQGAALIVGDGRVAVFGEAAMFTSQATRPGHAAIGFDHPEATWNRQFARNVIRWLVGELPAR
ncbi:MAG TPA: DUF4350 domain-containing protein [Candidatus Krumholzibacteria bacterium]|nr:DUF4350 domain-containing protein [Candidatus Krumholzibacteria bacterium]HPD72276.1 DUF4350 domain-containing protein [Candidatus Krumholzibacteria bacterium]HRY40792.1 DUF4350 domain-containing protein [Candidatus Krumholzibacteria bacterium]